MGKQNKTFKCNDLKQDSNNSKTQPFYIADGNSVHLDISVKDRIKILLRRKGISQNQLADSVSVSIGTMSKIVNGDWIPTSKVMLKISEVLDCDSVVIFGDTDYWKKWRDKMIYPEEEKEND